ncbi:MAG: hypothetical protein ACRENP_02585 [Longimicrobiales bacterium]
MTIEPTSDPAREFLARTIAHAGGIVEDALHGLEALLPAPAAARLDLPEELALHLSSGTPVGGTADGRIGSALLERLVATRLERAALTAVALPPGLPLPLPDHLPVLLNAVKRDATEPRRTTSRYLAADLRLTLQGEELRSVLVSLTIRIADGARTEPFRVRGRQRISASRLDDSEQRRAREALRSWLSREGPALHANGLATLRRRAVRDLERMADYYAGLEAEMQKAAQRARSAEERARRQAKRASLPMDLDARREQLRVRMRPRLAARLIAATLIEADVEHFEVALRRRNRAGNVTITCRSSDGVFEGPACASCSLSALRFYLCDQKLHVLCSACGQNGRLDEARCRACRAAEPEMPAISVDDPTTRLRLGQSSES